jgi:hypothetical protein
MDEVTANALLRRAGHIANVRKKVRTAPRGKGAKGPGSYPWDQCMTDATKRYGSDERARRVCGSIRAKSKRDYPSYWKERAAKNPESRENYKGLRIDWFRAGGGWGYQIASTDRDDDSVVRHVEKGHLSGVKRVKGEWHSEHSDKHKGYKTAAAAQRGARKWIDAHWKLYAKSNPKRWDQLSQRWHGTDPNLDTRMRKDFEELMSDAGKMDPSDRADYRAWAVKEIEGRYGMGQEPD